VNIEFATEEFLSGSSVICPQCGKEKTPILSVRSKPASDPQPQAEILQVISGQDYYLAKELQLGDANYILYLAPGYVRHLQSS